MPRQGTNSVNPRARPMWIKNDPKLAETIPNQNDPKSKNLSKTIPTPENETEDQTPTPTSLGVTLDRGSLAPGLCGPGRQHRRVAEGGRRRGRRRPVVRPKSAKQRRVQQPGTGGFASWLGKVMTWWFENRCPELREQMSRRVK